MKVVRSALNCIRSFIFITLAKTLAFVKKRLCKKNSKMLSRRAKDSLDASLIDIVSLFLITLTVLRKLRQCACVSLGRVW